MDSNFQIDKLVRQNIRRLTPYSSARDDFSGSASVFLDANENPHNAPLNRYPDPQQMDLKKVIAGIKGVQVGNIFLGNGSDEGIDLLFRVLCEPGRDNVITVDPTYGMYGVCAGINNVERRSVLLSEDFSLDPQAVIDAVDPQTRMIFLCSPNNPTSNSLDQGAMLKIIDHVHCMVVVDEAYIDFSSRTSMLSRLKEKPNLVLLQTLSKAWALAGIRLGMVFARADLIAYLSRVKYPYNISTLTMEAAIQGLHEREKREDWIGGILSERRNLEEYLGSLDFVEKVYPSDANFLLIRVHDPSGLYHYLMQRGIIVRDRSSVPRCAGCLRITVGSAAENRALTGALAAYDQLIKIKHG